MVLNYTDKPSFRQADEDNPPSYYDVINEKNNNQDSPPGILCLNTCRDFFEPCLKLSGYLCLSCCFCIMEIYCKE